MNTFEWLDLCIWTWRSRLMHKISFIGNDRGCQSYHCVNSGYRHRDRRNRRRHQALLCHLKLDVLSPVRQSAAALQKPKRNKRCSRVEQLGTESYSRRASCESDIKLVKREMCYSEMMNKMNQKNFADLISRRSIISLHILRPNHRVCGCVCLNMVETAFVSGAETRL